MVSELTDFPFDTREKHKPESALNSRHKYIEEIKSWHTELCGQDRCYVPEDVLAKIGFLLGELHYRRRMMDEPTTVLRSVNYQQVGKDGVTKIILRTDGNGLSGYYDMIYVYFDNRPTMALPAHNCECWVYE